MSFLCNLMLLFVDLCCYLILFHAVVFSFVISGDDVREGGSSHNLINVLAVRCLLRSPQRISAISFPFPLSNNLQYISYELLCLECKRYIQRKGLEKDL